MWLTNCARNKYVYKYVDYVIKRTATPIEKVLINNRLRVSKVP